MITTTVWRNLSLTPVLLLAAVVCPGLAAASNADHHEPEVVRDGSALQITGWNPTDEQIIALTAIIRDFAEATAVETTLPPNDALEHDQSLSARFTRTSSYDGLLYDVTIGGRDGMVSIVTPNSSLFEIPFDIIDHAAGHAGFLNRDETFTSVFADFRDLSLSVAMRRSVNMPLAIILLAVIAFLIIAGVYVDSRRRRVESDQRRRVAEKARQEADAARAEADRARREVNDSRRRLMQVREDEKSRIAAFLHDGPIQDLQHAVRSYSAVRMAEEREADDWLQRQLEEVTVQLRDVCADLRPPVLRHFGLASAMRSHVAHVADRHPEMNIRSRIVGGELRLQDDIELDLFRIAQEGLNNALKHSEAENVIVELQLDKSEASIAILDDGQGFVVPERLIHLELEGHMGLSILHQRAEALGGHLEITSESGKGTIVRLTCRLSPGPTPSTGRAPLYSGPVASV